MEPEPSAAPREVYQRRLAQRQTSLEGRKRRDSLISNLRLVVFLLGVGLGIALLTTDALSLAWLLAPLVAFIALVLLHDHEIRALNRAHGAVRHYQYLIDRVDHKWSGTGVQRVDFVPEEHPYAADLDLFGKGSLFELLCTARTRAGEEALARWLAAPAPVDEVIARQESVEELRSRLDLREDLALLAGGVRADLNPEILSKWGSADPVFPKASLALVRFLAIGLTLLALAMVALWAATSVGPLPFFAVLILEWIVYRALGKRLTRVMEAVEQPERELLVLSEILTRLESEPFSSAHLVELQRRLGAGGLTASACIRRLDRLVMWLDARRNAFFAPIGFVLMWTLHFAAAIEAWRLEAGSRIHDWLEAIGEFEALCALAGYAYEHPGDPFPELAPSSEPLFDGEALGHPLLNEDDCVRNHVTLGEGTRAWIVSGSNMSGKTTLLRTVGTNAVLAQAGAPVRAMRLRLSPLAVGATIQVHDSLQAGRSRFYAEINRLKQLMDLTGEDGAALLFLLDEILHGTNSHDRQLGARALLGELINAGAIGLVTTHDLALADAGPACAGKIDNVHFSDQVVDGELVFDYSLRPGVVQGSNAIVLMRAVGLELGDIEA